MRTVTSIRGRPSSSSGIGLEPVDPAASRGSTPAARRAARGSRPRRRRAVRIAAVPQTTIPTVSGCAPSSSRWRRSSASASRAPDVAGEVATAAPAGRPSRSCARSAARRARPRVGEPDGPAGTWRPRGRRAGGRSRRSCRRRGTTSSPAKRSAVTTPRLVPSTSAQSRRGLGRSRAPKAAISARCASCRRSTRSAPLVEAGEARQQRWWRVDHDGAGVLEQRRLVEAVGGADRAPQAGHALAQRRRRRIAASRPRSCSPSGARPRMCRPSRTCGSLSSHR